MEWVQEHKTIMKGGGGGEWINRAVYLKTHKEYFHTGPWCWVVCNSTAKLVRCELEHFTLRLSVTVSVIPLEDQALME